MDTKREVSRAKSELEDHLADLKDYLNEEVTYNMEDNKLVEVASRVLFTFMFLIQDSMSIYNHDKYILQLEAFEKQGVKPEDMRFTMNKHCGYALMEELMGETE